MPVDPAEYMRVMRILKANASKTFVDRILRRDLYPKLDLGDGNYATHKMAYGEADGKYHVFPTVGLVGDKLVDYGPDEGWKKAMESKDYISFDNPQDADWFSQRYKAAWGE